MPTLTMSDAMDDESSEVRNNRWWPLLAIIAALILWALFLALGAYWAPAGEQAGHDRRKLWVVAATTGGFLTLWGVALWFGTRRQRRIRQKREDPEILGKNAKSR
jgi:hypothetical protein